MCRDVRACLAPLTLGLVLALGGCGRSEVAPAPRPGPVARAVFPAGWPSEAERTMMPGYAPTPYTAAQVRAGCAAGRVIVLREVEGSAPPVFHWFKFTGGDDVAAEFSAGQGSSPSEEPSTLTPLKVPWVGLQAHASYPQARTTVSFERLDTPLGTLDCALYTVTDDKDGAPQVTHSWFAFDLPGPPVRQTVTEEGVVVLTSEMVRSAPPK